MTSKARTDSLISSDPFDTRSNYSQSTGDEQDDYDDPTIEDTRDSHVTTPNKHPEASEIRSEKAQSPLSSETYAKDSLLVMLTNMKTQATDLLDEANRALSKVSLSGEDLQNRLRSAEEDRDHYRERKEEYKKYKSVLEKEIQELRNDLAAFQNIMAASQNQLAASQQEVTKLREARNEMIEEAKKLFSA
jgi:chromosome segregation ATPase